MSSSAHSGTGSFLRGWIDRSVRHPDAFVCGVRVIDGDVNGESRRWAYRASFADTFPFADGTTGLRHGKVQLRLRFERPDASLRARSGYDAWLAVDVLTGATVAVSFRPEAADRMRTPDYSM